MSYWPDRRNRDDDLRHAMRSTFSLYTRYRKLDEITSAHRYAASVLALDWGDLPDTPEWREKAFALFDALMERRRENERLYKLTDAKEEVA